MNACLGGTCLCTAGLSGAPFIINLLSEHHIILILVPTGSHLHPTRSKSTLAMAIYLRVATLLVNLLNLLVAGTISLQYMASRE